LKDKRLLVLSEQFHTVQVVPVPVRTLRPAIHIPNSKALHVIRDIKAEENFNSHVRNKVGLQYMRRLCEIDHLLSTHEAKVWVRFCAVTSWFGRPASRLADGERWIQSAPIPSYRYATPL
jgi:hypothetical protein